MLWQWMIAFVIGVTAGVVIHMTRSWARVTGCIGALLLVALASAAVLGLGGGLIYGIVWVARRAWGAP